MSLLDTTPRLKCVLTLRCETQMSAKLIGPNSLLNKRVVERKKNRVQHDPTKLDCVRPVRLHGHLSVERRVCV